MSKVKVLLASKGAILPKKATEGSAAFDVYACEDTYIGGECRVIVSTGLRMAIEKGYEVKIEGRSGYDAKGFEGYDELSSNESVRFIFAEVKSGKIDSDYRGIVGVIVANFGKQGFWIKKGQRIAQMTIYKVENADNELEVVDELDDTARGDGGFGHSGSK